MKIRHHFRLSLICLAVVAGLPARVREKRSTTPPVATPSLTLEPRSRAGAAARSRLTYKFVVANDAQFDRGLPGLRARRRHRRRADVDRRSQSADADVAVEAGTDDRVHADDFRSGVSVRRRCHDRTSACTRRRSEAADARRRGCGQHAYKVAKLQLLPQTDNLFTVFKDGWHPAEVAEQNAAVEWQWTKKTGDARVQESEEGQRLLPRRRQPGAEAPPSGSTSRSARRTSRRGVHARTRRAASCGRFKLPAAQLGDGRYGRTADHGRSDVRPGAVTAATVRIRASWVFACSTRYVDPR